MGGTARTIRFARLGGNLSLLAAMSACLVMWGGINLLHAHSSTTSVDEPVAPQPMTMWERSPEGRRALANLLLFWFPLSLGAIACGSGIVTLACSGERDWEACHRALLALILSAIPGFLSTLWYTASYTTR